MLIPRKHEDNIHSTMLGDNVKFRTGFICTEKKLFHKKNCAILFAFNSLVDGIEFAPILYLFSSMPDGVTVVPIKQKA